MNKAYNINIYEERSSDMIFVGSSLRERAAALVERTGTQLAQLILNLGSQREGRRQRGNSVSGIWVNPGLASYAKRECREAYADYASSPARRTDAYGIRYLNRYC